MKSLIRKILYEEVHRFHDFASEIIKHHPQTKSFMNEILDFIDKSGCKRIEFDRLPMGIMGIALHDRVVVNRQALFLNINMFLYILFHEIAHQFQYRKYGDEKMYEFYTGESSVKEAAESMLKIENVADELAIRKLKEFIRKGYLTNNYVPNQNYKGIPAVRLEPMIEKYRKDVMDAGLKNPDDISEYLYNKIKNVQTTFQ